jgi:hypothetical protein
VQIADAMLLNCSDVLFCTVTNVFIKAVLREFFVISAHDFIAVHFGNNGGKFNAVVFFITPHNSTRI